MNKRFAALIPIVISAVIAETFGWGWSKMLDTASAWVGGINFSARDAWGIISLLGMTAGFVMFFWPQKPRQTKSTVLANKALDFVQLADRVLHQGLNGEEGVVRASANGHAVRSTFALAGFAVPTFPNYADPFMMLHIMRRYFFGVAALLAEGHMKEAKAFAARFHGDPGLPPEQQPTMVLEPSLWLRIRQHIPLLGQSSIP